jgi:hypothetical protein
MTTIRIRRTIFTSKIQNRITFSDNLDSNSNSEITESSTFNDTESSTSGGTNNEPDSPSLLNNVSKSNNNLTKIFCTQVTQQLRQLVVHRKKTTNP